MIATLLANGELDAGPGCASGRAALPRPGSFDVVLYRLVLHHLAYQGPLEPVLSEAARLLRPGGALVAVEPGLVASGGRGARAGQPAGVATWAHGTPDDIPLSPRALVAEARAPASARAPRPDATAGGPAGAARSAPFTGLDPLGSRPRGGARSAHAAADRPRVSMASRYDDELWELVPEDPGPAAPVLAEFVRGLAPRRGRARPRLRRRPARVALSTPIRSPSRTSRWWRSSGRGAAPAVRARGARARRPLPFEDGAFDLVSAPRRSSTCATSSSCSRRSAACCGPAGGSRVTTPGAPALMRPP